MLNRLLIALLPVVVLVAAPSAASADDDYYSDGEAPPPAPPPGPPPVYTAPLSQTTQTTYVPQSVALSGPDEIADDGEGRPAPAGYTTVYRKRKGLLIGGGAVFGASYGLSIMIAAIGSDIGGSDGNEVASMWIPVAGPFLQMAQTESATLRLFLAGVGAAQTTGAILLYYGLTTKKKVYVRNDLVGSLQITPYTGDGQTGMLLSGRF